MNSVAFETGAEQGPDGPYRAVFSEIEELARSRERLEPHQAYKVFDDHLVAKGLDPTIYLSMAITSGGFARDENLGIGQVIEQNTAYGELAKAALLRQHPALTADDIIVPSELGKVRGWSQSDYLLFWFHTIAGVKSEYAEEIDGHMAQPLQYPGFTDKSLSLDERWSDYARFAGDYVRALERLGNGLRRGEMQPNNIQAMVMILDKGMSLGGRAEEMLCRMMGIPPQLQYMDPEMIEAVPGLTDATHTLRGLGAQALSGVTNPPGMRMLGISFGRSDPDVASRLGFRKTNFMNAILTAEYYRRNPGSRPPRHQGHRPLHVRRGVPADRG